MTREKSIFQCLTNENPETTQIQGPMTRSRTKQSVDTLQQMVAGILRKAQVEKDEGPSGERRRPKWKKKKAKRQRHYQEY